MPAAHASADRSASDAVESDQILSGMLRDQPKRLFRRALSLGLSPHDAEDAAQNVALTALIKIDGVSRSDEATICSWIDTIARRMVIDHYRKISHEREMPLDALVDSEGGDSVSSAVEQEMLVGAVINAISALDDVPRKIVKLRYFAEMSTQEIAAELGMSDAAVRQRLSRARTALAAPFV